MVRKVSFCIVCLIAILSVQSCSINSHGNLNGQGSSLSITSPNNGESFRTNEEGSVIIGGICEKGTDVDLVTVPERSVTNNWVVSTKLCKHLQSLIGISFPVGEGFPS